MMFSAMFLLSQIRRRVVAVTIFNYYKQLNGLRGERGKKRVRERKQSFITLSTKRSFLETKNPISC